MPPAVAEGKDLRGVFQLMFEVFRVSVNGNDRKTFPVSAVPVHLILFGAGGAVEGPLSVAAEKSVAESAGQFFFCPSESFALDSIAWISS